MEEKILLASILEQLELMDPETRCHRCYHSECVGGPYIPGDTGALICYGFGCDMGKLICKHYGSSTTCDVEYRNKKITDINFNFYQILKNINEIYEKNDYENVSSYEVKW